MADQISAWMLSKIQAGEAILFLGAGASYGAEIDGTPQHLSGNKLRDLLCDKFLGSEQKDKYLVQVADYAKHQAGFDEVQVFIKDQFHPLRPSEFQKLIPLFRWHAIFTTNYDLIVERAYDLAPKRLQNLSPIIRDGDQFSSVMKDPDKLPFFKLHGCISTINDENLPLILASEEYAKHRKNRKRLFQHLADFGREHPIIFCGYQILDPNIQQILFDLKDIGISRPNYMVVDPGLNKFDETMWKANRIDTYKHSFAEFITYINANIDPQKRVLSRLIDVNAKSYRKNLKNDKRLSDNLINYLEMEFEHVYEGMPAEGVQPKDFYTGLDDGWGGVSQKLDVKRKVNDQILIDSIIDDSLKGSSTFLIKGHAGSGKSITLRRIAWDAANDFGSSATIFYLKKGAVFRPSLVKELCEAIDGRVVILVEDALYNKSDLLKFYELLMYDDSDVSIISTARNNEWNQHGGDLEQYISAEYELDKLLDSEIAALIENLSANNCLGNLKKISTDEIKHNFQLTSDRQLLVALHEATGGKSFEEIVFDEYQRVTPMEAQLLYMDVCTLNRMNVPVRAGLISRISGIGIEDFNRDFISPLEHLVKVYMDQRSRDYVYVCRHPLIADLVFDYANANPSEKARQIVRVLSKMNIDYEADKTAFIELIKGKTMATIFSDKGLAKQIYNAAEEAGAPLYYIWHQRAVFELNHPGSDLNAALSAIQNAESNVDSYRSDKSILHTKALIYKKMAGEANSPLEKDKYRAEARLILEKLIRKGKDSRSSHALAELALDELEDKLQSDSIESGNELQERAVLNIVKKAEDTIYAGLQNYPNDEYLLSSKANLAKKLKDHDTVRQILERAYKTNDSSDYIAISLARNIYGAGDIEGALSIIRSAVAKSPNSRPLHLALAKYLISTSDQSNATEIMHHLKRSFSPNDTNYDAQFWFARQNYLYGNREEAIRTFEQLKKARMSPRQSRAIDGHCVDNIGNNIRYNGQIASDHVDFFFIRCSEINDSIYSHVSHYKTNKEEPTPSVGVEVNFNLAFNMRGPIAIDVRPKYNN